MPHLTGQSTDVRPPTSEEDCGEKTANGRKGKRGMRRKRVVGEDNTRERIETSARMRKMRKGRAEGGREQRE